MLLAAGVPMKVISALLGHGSIGVTINLYAHLLPDARADAVRDLDRFLAQPRSGMGAGIVVPLRRPA